VRPSRPLHPLRPPHPPHPPHPLRALAAPSAPSPRPHRALATPRHTSPHLRRALRTPCRCSSRAAARSHPSQGRRPRRSQTTISPRTRRSRSASPPPAASTAWSETSPPWQRPSAPPLRLLRAAPGGSRRRSTPKGRDRPTTGLPTTTLSLQAYAVAPAGKVSFGRVIAPDGKNFLACARSIGDGRFKTDTPLGAHLRSDLVPATPDVASHALGPEDRFVVLASDGVSRPGCNPMRGRPQPRVLQAATPRAAGCNPTCRRPHPHSP